MSTEISEFDDEIVEVEPRELVPAVPERPDLIERAKSILSFFKSTKVTDAILYKEVDDYRKEAANSQSIVKDVYAEAREYFHERHKAVTSKQNAIIKLFKDAEDEAKKMLKAYDAEQERIRREEAEKLRREAEERLRRQREAEAERLREEGKTEQAEEVAAEPIPEVMTPEVQIESAARGNSYRDNWIAKVVDESLVPDQFKIIDTKALAAYAKATKGQKAVPGVEFINDEIFVGSKR